ncbi:Heat shock factor (HSF)-type DNA-binding, partial [Arabidopsis thaliana x Arabidopsis arenosa]
SSAKVKSSVSLRRPFVTCLDRTYEVVDDPSTDSIISWSQSGKSFIVWNPSEFCKDLLHRCFGHHHFPLFTRTLNDYGIKKVDSELWEFADDDFVKGRPELIRNINNRGDSDSDSESRVSTRNTILKKKNNAESRVSTRVTIQTKKKKKKTNKLVAKAIAAQFQGLEI